MRVRTRMETKNIQGLTEYGYSEHYTYGTFPDYISLGAYDRNLGVYQFKDSDISDVLAYRPQVVVDPLTGQWERIKNPKSPFGSNTIRARQAALSGLYLKPVHRCFHDQTKIELKYNLDCSFSSISSPGNPVFERLNTWSLKYLDGASLLYDNVRFLTDVDSVLQSSSASYYTASEFRKHDWFALTDAFNEACDQFIPSSFLAGEDMAQCGIFIDALKLVLNPTRAIPNLIKAGLRLSKKSRRGNLGQMSKHLLRNSANANLLWQFGIKPAINDIKAVLNAHESVGMRLSELRRHAGQFIPVRVRRKIPSSIDNSPLSVPDGSQSTKFEWQCSEKYSLGVISAFGRVREDLNFGDDWSAYLQYFGINKVVGLAWELIPFSFVVDWFTNAQERINELTRSRTGGPFCEIRNLCASEKNVLVEDLYCVPGYNYTLGMPMVTPNDPFVVATRHTTSYNRYNSIPDASGVVDLSTLGLFHLLTSGSLIVQKLFR